MGRVGEMIFGIRTCAIVVALGVISGEPAWAEAPRSMFCVAMRTAPKLDQNNYAVGRIGPNYLTRDFTTDAPIEELNDAWRSYTASEHPRRYPDNPDDACYPAKSRRVVMSEQTGEVRNVTVPWPPAKTAKP